MRMPRALSMSQVRFAAVFAAQEPRSESEVADHAEPLGAREILQLALEQVTVIQVVPGLQRLVACQAALPGNLQCLRQAWRAVVGGADGAHFTGSDQAIECGGGLLQRRRSVVDVSLVQIDDVSVQPSERALNRGLKVAARQAPSVRSRHAQLGGDDHLPAPPTSLSEPGADDRLRFPRGVPGGIYIRGIDQVEAALDERVEQTEYCGLIDCPAEDITAERPWRNHQTGSTELLSIHFETA